MTWAFITGGLVGLGRTCWCGCSSNRPRTCCHDRPDRRRPDRYSHAATASAAGERVLGGLDKARASLGRRLEFEANARLDVRQAARDLAVMNQPFAAMLATKVFFALGAMIFIPIVLFLFSMLGLGAPGATPAIVTLADGVRVLPARPGVAAGRRHGGATSGTWSAASSTWSR